MWLLGLSLLFGFIGTLLACLFGIDGSMVNENFAFAMWMIGFFSPSIYVLDKLYKEIKKEKT